VSPDTPVPAPPAPGDAPVVLHRGSALEVVRWPLTERVQLLLDTHALYIERGALLAMIRSGQRELALPLLEIESVSFADDGQSVTFKASRAREVTLNGDEAIRVGAMLWALGVPGRPTPAAHDELVGSSGIRINQAVDATGAVVVGPRGLAFAPSGLFRQLVGGAALRITGPSVGGAWLEPNDTLAVQHGNATHRFRMPEAASLLQALRQAMSRGEEQEVDSGGRLPVEIAQGHLAGRAEEDPPPPDPGDVLLAGRGVWTPDEETALRATIVLGAAHVLLLPDDPSRAAWRMPTGRLRRGDGPDDPVDSPLLRLSGRAHTTIVRPVGGPAFVREFWRNAAPHQYVVPSEDYDPEPWRGVVGPARFLRLTPEDLSEHVHRPALLVQRDDGVSVILPPDALWPWNQGEFLRAEVSRPRGVFRFAAQFLREDTTTEIPREAVAQLGTARDAAFRTMVLMPGPLPPALQPPKRALLRLPTDEPVKVIVRSIAGDDDESTPLPGAELEGRLADLSASGCAVQLRRAIPPGSQLMVIPGGQGRYLFRAEVMGLRVMPEAVRLAPKLEFELGLRFMGLNESRLSWLQREVLSRQRKRLTIRATATDDDEDALPLLDRHYHA
jgi:hypothetical protein